MKMTSRLASVLFAAAAAWLVAMPVAAPLAPAAARADEHAGAPVSLLGQEAPPFTLTSVDHRTVRLADLKGHPVLIYFTSGSGPLLDASAAVFQSFYDKFRDRDVEVLIIQVKQDPERVRKWAETLKLTATVLLDSDGSVAAKYLPAGISPDLPRAQAIVGTKLMVDVAGKICYEAYPGAKALDSDMVPLLNAMVGASEAGERGSNGAGSSASPVIVHAPGRLGIPRGKTAQVLIALEVASGFRIVANPSGGGSVTPLRLEMAGVEGLRPGSPVYPAGEAIRLEGAKTELLTYAGMVRISLPLEAMPSAATGERVLKGTLYYQACDGQKLLAPSWLPVKLTVQVSAPGSGGTGR